MKTKIVFQLTEDQLKQLTWTIKNYGHSVEEESDVTPEEMSRAKSALESYMQGFEEHLAAVLTDN